MPLIRRPCVALWAHEAACGHPRPCPWFRPGVPALSGKAENRNWQEGCSGCRPRGRYGRGSCHPGGGHDRLRKASFGGVGVSACRGCGILGQPEDFLGQPFDGDRQSGDWRSAAFVRIFSGCDRVAQWAGMFAVECSAQAFRDPGFRGIRDGHARPRHDLKESKTASAEMHAPHQNEQRLEEAAHERNATDMSRTSGRCKHDLATGLPSPATWREWMTLQVQSCMVLMKFSMTANRP